MRIFIPVEDAPGVASLGLLVPYRCGLVCEHAMRDMADFVDVRPDMSVTAPVGSESPRSMSEGRDIALG